MRLCQPVVADLTADFSHLPADYAAIVSAGTFTRRPSWPDPLVALLEHCAPGAVAALGVNSLHFEQHAFSRCLTGLSMRAGSARRLTEVPIYDGRSADHANDTAFVMTFTIS